MCVYARLSKENSKELRFMQYAFNLGWIDPGFSLKPSGHALNQDKYETLGTCSTYQPVPLWKIFIFLYNGAKHNLVNVTSGLIHLQGPFVNVDQNNSCSSRLQMHSGPIE